jgi:hypothetical protein
MFKQKIFNYLKNKKFKNYYAFEKIIFYRIYFKVFQNY